MTIGPGARIGSHTVLAKIGQGGMGSVYLARGANGERVAVKVFEGRLESDSAGLKRFAQELDTLRRVEHPRLVRALSPVEFDGEHHYFVMEYVRGRNLAQVLDEVGRLEPDDAFEIVGQALEGLAAAHAAGILHRDLKPANLLIDGEGQVKVCDFGLARAIDLTRLTLSGQLLGTPAYASPEQAAGQDSRVESDLYSLGVVLYEALTGTLPFRAETPLAVLRLHLDEQPDPPSARRPGLDPAVDALLARALAKSPAERFASAEALRAELKRVAEAEAIAPDLRSTIAVLVEAETERLEAQAGSVAPRALPALFLIACGAVAVFAVGFSQRAQPNPTTPPSAEAAPITSEAAPPAPPAPARRVVIVLGDGTQQEGRLVAIERGEVVLRQADGREARLPRETVREIRYLDR